MFRIVRAGLLCLLLGVVIMLVRVPTAAANDQTCDHLISAPGTSTVGIKISVPGTYCLATDLIMAATFKTGHAIEIDANYVVLDLNGHKVHGANAGTATQAIGIYANNRLNVTIKNGAVWGFMYGILLSESNSTGPAEHLVERVRAENNRIVGIYISNGANVVVRHNIVANTGPTTAFPSAPAYGIDVFNNTNARIIDNDIVTVTGTGGSAAVGIIVSGVYGLVVGNRISDALQPVFAVDQKCRDNLTNGVAALVQCTFDAGGNN